MPDQLFNWDPEDIGESLAEDSFDELDGPLRKPRPIGWNSTDG
jgi:hypothetical protein